MTRTENNLSSSNLYHIKAAENRMFRCMSHLKEKKKIKPELFYTDRHMENCGGSESVVNAFLFITKKKVKFLPDQ